MSGAAPAWVSYLALVTSLAAVLVGWRGYQWGRSRVKVLHLVLDWHGMSLGFPSRRRITDSATWDEHPVGKLRLVNPRGGPATVWHVSIFVRTGLFRIERADWGPINVRLEAEDQKDVVLDMHDIIRRVASRQPRTIRGYRFGGRRRLWTAVRMGNGQTLFSQESINNRHLYRFIEVARPADRIHQAFADD